MKKLIIIFLPVVFILMIMYEKWVPTQELLSKLSSENVAVMNVRTIKTNTAEAATDDNNLEGNWHFSYSCTQSSEETWKSTNEDHTKKSSGSGSGSMIVDAPPEQNGDVIINTEQGDPVINSTVNGTYTYYESDITTGPNNEIDEKRITNYSGKPAKGQGLLFEYNSKDKGDQGGIQGAGISFDITGTDEIWNHDANGKLRKVTNPADEKAWAGIGLGHMEDKVTKIKNGFAIDYNQTKDSSNTYGGGVKHTFKSTEQYHAELIRVPKN